MNYKNSPKKPFRNQNYSGQDLRGKKFFIGQDIQGSNFSDANLQGVDFSSAKIRGANFCGANLRGAKFNYVSSISVETDTSLDEVDFTNAKIQGTDFTEAVLQNANFTEAKAGLSLYWRLIVFLFSFILCLFSAFPAAIISTFSLHFLRGSHRRPSFLFLMLTGLVSVVITVAIRTLLIISAPNYATIIHVILGIIAIIMTLFGAAITMVMNDFEDDLSSILSATLPLLFLLVVLIGLIIFTETLKPLEELVFRKTYFQSIVLSNKTNGALLAGVFGALIGAPIGCWFSGSAIAEDKKVFYWLWKIYIWFVTYKGTLFNEADITDAIFASATLKGANFKGAKVIRTRWKGVKHLEFTYTGNNYLKYPKIRQLATTLVVGEKTKDRKFDGLNLEGIYLEKATLSCTNFSGANLNHANLRYAILLEADLTQAKLNNADLTGASLTGACIDNWTTDQTTILNEVICEYIYLEKLPGNMSGWRRSPPQPNNFEPGYFENFYRKDNVIYLPISKNDDRQALEDAFSHLVKQNPGIRNALTEIKMIGDNNVLVTIRVPKNTDKGKIEQEFEQTKQEGKQKHQLHSELEKRYNEPFFQFILDLIKEVMSSTPQFFAPNSNINIANMAGKVKGSQNSTLHINSQEHRQTLAEAASEIQNLLKQLEQSNPTATDAEKVAYVNEKTAPTLKSRVLSALQGGSEAAIEEFLSNPYINVGKAIVKGWIKPE
ncbi:pentapeptide repeat-containing protein [Nostoc sp.]|uniref:pentapeptide repeat-containing protein n=1 Tax=Nostoc sp. TaxID=1180 RepID=UPI002FF72045